MSRTFNVIGFRTLLGRECHRFLRLYNQTLIPPVVTAVLFILIFGYSLGSRIRHVQDVEYMAFLVPGLVMMSVINSAFNNTSSSLFIARFQRNIEELLVSSMSSLEIVSALILGGVLRAILVCAMVTTAALLLTDTGVLHIGITVYFVLAVAFIFSCAGFLSAIWAENFDQLAIFQTYLLTPLTYLGGVFFSVDMLPGVWQTVARANPLLYFINGLRYGFIGITDVPVFPAMVAVLLVGIAMFLSCYALFRRGYNIKA